MCPRHLTQLLFVSLDPARDDATRLKSYLAPFDGELVAATGSAQALAAVADEFGVHMRDAADYLLKRARRR